MSHNFGFGKGVNDNTMICRECGARIDDNASECKFCGAVYGETESVEPIPEPVAEESLTSEMAQEEIDAIIDENEIKRHAQIEKLSQTKHNNNHRHGRNRHF